MNDDDVYIYILYVYIIIYIHRVSIYTYNYTYIRISYFFVFCMRVCVCVASCTYAPSCYHVYIIYRTIEKLDSRHSFSARPCCQARDVESANFVPRRDNQGQKG